MEAQSTVPVTHRKVPGNTAYTTSLSTYAISFVHTNTHTTRLSSNYLTLIYLQLEHMVHVLREHLLVARCDLNFVQSFSTRTPTISMALTDTCEFR